MAKAPSPLDLCPACCGKGRLEVVLELGRASDVDQSDRIAYLACDCCGAMYHTKSRGSHLASILRPMTDWICKCSKSNKRTTRFNGQTFVYCGTCLTIIDVNGEPERQIGD
jgi:hypothetical protein